MLFKKLILSFILALAIINPIAIYAISLVPGGDSIGIELDYQGVVITGGYKIKVGNESYDPLAKDFKVGDIIVAMKISNFLRDYMSKMQLAGLEHLHFITRQLVLLEL